MRLTLTDANGRVILDEQADVRDASNPFSSGKTGFGSYGKVKIGEDRFQLSFNLVKIAAK